MGLIAIEPFRTPWHLLQEKTSKHGQPFACKWHGVTGRSYSSSWVFHWLGRPARQFTATRIGSTATARPDFLFINCGLLEAMPQDLAPASYSRTLLHLRWASQSTQILGSTAPKCAEACDITLHSLKSTMLACAAQLKMPKMLKEHRVPQGHHRDSALFYSRNDTFSGLSVQSTICTNIK